jgi:hypothetical protein
VNLLISPENLDGDVGANFSAKLASRAGIPGCIVYSWGITEIVDLVVHMN